MALWKSALFCLLSGIVLPVIGTIALMYVFGRYRPEIRCLTGVAGMAPFGWIVT